MSKTLLSLPLVRNLSLSFTSKLVTVAANLGFVAITARLFSKEDVAVLALAGITTALMEVSKGLGLGTLLLKQLPKLPPEASAESASLVTSYLFYSLLPPALLAVLASALARPLSAYFLDTSSRAGSVRLAIWLAVFTAGANTVILIFQATQQFGMLVALTVAANVVQRVVPCLLAPVLALSLEGFLQWSVWLTAAGFLLTLIPVIRVVSAPGRRLLSPSRFWPESRHFYYAGLLRYAATQIDQLFVAAMFAPATLAVYYMLRRLYSIAVLMISSLIEALVPDLSRQAGRDRSAAQQRLQDWLRLVLLFGAAGGALLAGNGETLIGWVLGAGYAGDGMLVMLFAISAVTYSLLVFAQMDLLLFHEPRTSLELAMVTAAVNTASGPLLAGLLGTGGLPLAMAISSIAGLGFSGRRHGLLSWRPGRLGVAVGMTVASSALAAGSLWWRTLAVNALIVSYTLVQLYCERRAPGWLSAKRASRGV